MKKEQFLNMMNQIDDALLIREDATVKQPAGKSLWLKVGTVAACFALVVILGVGMIQRGLFGGNEHIATLDNGDTISFVKSDFTMGQLDITVQPEARELTDNEIKKLFHDLPVTAFALFNTEDDSIMGIEGRIDGMRLIVSMTDIMFNDTIVEGEETASKVNGVPVNAGYFKFKNKETIIYYATFVLGESLVYIEHAGANDNAETLRNEIAIAIQNLIDNGAIDLQQIIK